MSSPKVTVVVVPRERFSCAQISLNSIYQNTQIPFELIYIDGNSPAPVKQYLQQQSEVRGFELIRTEQYLVPHYARNIGWERAKTPYVVFVDNDVIVTPGWLESLVKCTEETGAWAVAPLYLEGRLEDKRVHMAGAVQYIQEEEGRRTFHNHHICRGYQLEKAQAQLKMDKIDSGEFHVMFVQTQVKDRIGLFDEELKSLMDHEDFSLQIYRAGGSIYLQPESVVTYAVDRPFTWSDLPFTLIRWSPDWNRSSVEHFRAKWNIDKDDKHLDRMIRVGDSLRLRPIKSLFPWYKKLLGANLRFKVGTMLGKLVGLFAPVQKHS